MAKDSAKLIRELWNKLHNKPMGKQLYSWLFAKAIPYTGTVKPQVLELKPGYSRLIMKDRRKIRNHLKSIHALALANLGEFSSGLAFHYALPKNTRAIITKISTVYLKKARGTLTAECHCPVLESNSEQQLEVKAVITDEAGDTVAEVTAEWLIRPSLS